MFDSDVPDVTKVIANKVSTADQAVQAVVQQMDACSQTEECHEVLAQYQNDPSYFQGLTIAHFAEHPNDASSFTNNLGFMRSDSLANHANLPIIAHQPQVVASNSYPVTSENPRINFSPVNFPPFDNQYQMNHNPAMFNVQASGPNPPNAATVQPSNAGHQKKPVSATSIAAVVGGVKGEIVDECEDLAIQNEIEEYQRKLEKQPPSSPSYATAVKEKEPHRGGSYSLLIYKTNPRPASPGFFGRGVD